MLLWFFDVQFTSVDDKCIIEKVLPFGYTIGYRSMD